MDPFLLREKLTQLAELLGLSYEALRIRWQVIEDLPPEDRCQINPLEVRPSLQLADEDLFGFFLKATQVGLLIPRWCLVDLKTGGYVKTWSDFSAIYTEQEISPYTSDKIIIDLASNVEVCFQVIPGLYQDDIHEYDDYDSYVAFTRSRRFQPSDELRHFLHEGTLKYFQVFNSFELGKVPWEAQPGQSYRIYSPEARSALLVKTVAPPQQASFYRKMVLYRESKETVMLGMGKPVQNHEVTLTEDGFGTDIIVIQPGRVEIWVQSLMKSKAAIFMYLEDSQRLQQLLDRYPPMILPFLSAKALIGSRAYKEFNALSQSGSDHAFRVSDMTVMFSEMEPNFEIYEKAGDQKAYQLIQEMFSALQDLVTLTNGVVVKTMGTLIMAIFHLPEEGLLACEKIIDRILSYNSKNNPDKHLMIKAALHYGDALAVKTEGNVDYFGKVITTTIRLQSLADCMEMIATPELKESLGGRYGLEENGWLVREDTFPIQDGKSVNALRCHRTR